jgi:hypothetical protein
MEAVLWHCGQRMAVRSTVMEGQSKIRYCRCRACGLTGKTISEIPLGVAACRAIEDRRH